MVFCQKWVFFAPGSIATKPEMDRTSGGTPLTGSTLMRHTPSTLKAMELTFQWSLHLR